TQVNPALGGLPRVEIKVHESGPDALEASAGEVAALTAAQGWVFHLLVLGAVLMIAATYVGVHIGSGWVPADDGILGQSALRVMQGQLPHRDFTEIYTGGLDIIHALAFRVFGVSLMSLRLCAFLFFLAWIPAVYYIASRFTSAVAAGLIALVAVAWSYPNYPAAMPSWYNLFFATFGAAALLRYLDVRKARWLFVAGVCGGVSILIKVIGAYYIAGALLFLAFLEQSDVQGDESAEPNQSAIPYRVFSASALLLFLATVVYVFHARLGMGEFYHFVLPSAVLVALILFGERNVRNAATGQRFRSLLWLVLPFVGGLLTPAILFLTPYARSGALVQFFSGVASSAIARSVGLGVIRPVGIEKSLFALALAGLVVAAMYWREFQGKLVGTAIGLAFAVMLVKAGTSSDIVSGVWYSVATLTPLAVLLGAAVVLAAGKWGGATRLQQQRMMVPVSLAAICGLVQYPFAAPIYLCYALPLTLLAAVAIVATAKRQPGTYVLSAVAGFYLLFGVVMLVPDYVYELTHKVGPMDELHLERAGGLRIEYAANFADLIHFLQQHSPNGLMYAGNDCPELYFLSGLKNATRDDGGAPAEEVLQALQSDDLKLVVINEAPFFPSAKMGPEVRAEVARKFPNSSQFGIFHVFWKQ
ncbi:MAG TPA: glycosyltransferase family 39 protein, partial [Bryobacteraceae bacterium]|nr:glycosyltransferase family 39 protein [Bryobacteraceae bacterium]